MTGRTVDGLPLRPEDGNVDPIDVAAGMRELELCGWPASTEGKTHMVIQFALMRWARGEEVEAERQAVDTKEYGIDYTSWRRVLAAAVAAGHRSLKEEYEQSEDGSSMTERRYVVLRRDGITDEIQADHYEVFERSITFSRDTEQGTRMVAGYPLAAVTRWSTTESVITEK